VGFEGEERGATLTGEAARRRPQLAADSRARAGAARARPGGAPPPSNRSRSLARGDQLGGAPLEGRYGCREQAPRERSLGTGELAERPPLGRSGEAEERAPAMVSRSTSVDGAVVAAAPPAQRAGQREGSSNASSLSAHDEIAPRHTRARAAGARPAATGIAATVGRIPLRVPPRVRRELVCGDSDHSHGATSTEQTRLLDPSRWPAALGGGAAQPGPVDGGRAAHHRPARALQPRRTAKRRALGELRPVPRERSRGACFAAKP